MDYMVLQQIPYLRYLHTSMYVCMLSWKMYVNLDKVYCLIIFPDILQVDKKIIY